MIIELVSSLFGGDSPPVPPELLAVQEAEKAFLATCNAFREATGSGEIIALVHQETAALLALAQVSARAREAGYLVRWSPEAMREIGRRNLLHALEGPA